MSSDNVARAVEVTQQGIEHFRVAAECLEGGDPNQAIQRALWAKDDAQQVVSRARVECRKRHRDHAESVADCYLCEKIERQAKWHASLKAARP